MNLAIFLTDEEMGLLNDAAVSIGMSIGVVPSLVPERQLCNFY